MRNFMESARFGGTLTENLQFPIAFLAYILPVIRHLGVLQGRLSTCCSVCFRHHFSEDCFQHVLERPRPRHQSLLKLPEWTAAALQQRDTFVSSSGFGPTSAGPAGPSGGHEAGLSETFCPEHILNRFQSFGSADRCCT